MSETIAKAQAALAKEEGKLKKMMKALKKIFAKEFLWVLLVLLISVPFAVIIEHLLCLIDEISITVEALEDALGGYSLFMGVYVTIVVGIYFSRMVVGAIKILTKK